MSGRFEYLKQVNWEDDEEQPKTFEPIKKKPKNGFDDGTSRSKPNTKKRRPKRKK